MTVRPRLLLLAKPWPLNRHPTQDCDSEAYKWLRVEGFRVNGKYRVRSGMQRFRRFRVYRGTTNTVSDFNPQHSPVNERGEANSLKLSKDDHHAGSPERKSAKGSVSMHDTCPYTRKPIPRHAELVGLISGPNSCNGSIVQGLGSLGV